MNELKLIVGKALRKCSDLLMGDQFKMAIFQQDCHQNNYTLKSGTDCFEITDENGNVIRLRKKSSDFDVFQQVLLGNEYKAVANAALVNGISVKTIFDCGANIGLTSVYFSSIFKTSQIYAIEADSDNHLMLRQNVASIPNVIPIHRALWYENSELFLNRNFRDGRDWAVSVSLKEDAQFSESTVEGVTIAHLCKEYKITEIDILKIDIEGAEKEILLSPRYCEFLNFTKIIAVEIHDEFGIRADIYKVLRSFGFLILDSGETTVAVNLKLLNKSSSQEKT